MSEPRYPYVHVDVAPEQADEIGGLLFELGAAGVEERDAGTLAKSAASDKVTLVASFTSRAEAEEAIASLAEHELAGRYEEIVGDAWRDAWKEHYRPFAIAPGVVVRPPWESYTAKEGEAVLELEPGRAFGTGLHETTRLVARALAEHAKELAGVTVLDVGCGSGVLALVALVLGAKDAVAVDVDPESIEVTKENAARNGLADRVDASTTDIADVTLISPVVVANIEAKVLVPLAGEIARHVAPRGLLFLSGVLVPQADEVRAAYPGFEVLSSPSLGEWTLLALRRTAP
ncbi:MAG: 50S ribosomal protein L11 methyltransferase [Labilithrix sp.]|nr:50S ribosomal protein L11 methyltransferase [Labilithrix sp.]MCW5812230.1 50S ribosomal protein L11 methyltransferase [Labilithrix sp.]